MQRSLPAKLVGAMLALLLVASHALAQEARPASGVAGILARGTLRVALPAFASPPFFTDAKSEPAGFDIDMARAIGRELGVPVAFDRNAATFDDVVDIVARGEADLAICKLSRTLRRAQAVRFSQPYAAFKHALVVNRVRFAELAEGREAVEVMHDFHGTLGVIAGSSFAGYARANFPKADIREYRTWDNVVAAVRSGAVVAAYRDEFEIKKLIADDPALSLPLRTITLSDLTDTLGIAAAADNDQLVAFLDMYLSQRVRLRSADDMLALVPPSQQAQDHTQ